MGLTACSLVEHLENLDDILSGKYAIVYASAESATDKRFLSALKKSSVFQENLVACVVDETHTVETWTGLRGKKSKTRVMQAEAFRAAYGDLSILRSFFKEGTPVAALTGTADDSTIATVIKHLSLKEPLTIRISPNRANIRISVIKVKKENILCNLDWLIETIRDKAELTPKTIIFCNTMNDIAIVTNYLMLKLGNSAYSPQVSKDPKNCLIGIYHSSSWDQNKEKIVKSLKGEMKIRVVVSSSALSMGVNFPNITYVINWGPARSLIDQHQEFGRAGRDGKQSHALVLFHGHQLSHCEDTVKEFVHNDGCLRVAAYRPFDDCIKPGEPLHNCCSYCSKQCKCTGDDCDAEAPLFERYHNYEQGSTPIPSLTRPVSQEDKADLKGALMEVQQRSQGNQWFVGFSDQLTEDIINNCSRLFTVNDIMDTCPVYSLESALKILELLQEVFLDIPNFDECMDLLGQGDLSKSKELCLEDALKSIDLDLNVSEECLSESDDELPEVLNW